MKLTEQLSTPPQQSYRTIPLSRGQVAIVDAGDYDWLIRYSWNARWCKKSEHFYATRSEYVCHRNGKRIVRTYQMHREILGFKPGDPHVDHVHVDNTLDNRRENLRSASRSQNKANGHKYSNNTSGYKGVTWSKRKHVWIARVGVNGKRIHLGSFHTKEDAHAAYCEAAVRYFGEFARPS